MQDGFLSIDLQKGVCAWLWFHMELFFSASDGLPAFHLFRSLSAAPNFRSQQKEMATDLEHSWDESDEQLLLPKLTWNLNIEIHRNQRDIMFLRIPTLHCWFPSADFLFLEYVLLVGTFNFFGFSESGVVQPRNLGTVEEGWRVALWPRQVTANSQGNLDEKS